MSGGEPLMQAPFVNEFFKLCKEEGLHTALDTSGAFCHSANASTIRGATVRLEVLPFTCSCAFQ